MGRSVLFSGEEAEVLAAEALGFLAGDADRLGRFLALTGIAPAQIRQAARERGFLAGVLDHILSDERLTLAFAEERGVAPERIAEARAVLGRD